MKSTDRLTEGIKIGFEQARRHPELRLADFLHEINDLKVKLRAMPMRELEQLAANEQR